MEDAVPAKDAQETAIEKEWKEIRLQNEKDKEAMMNQSNQF
jgi:hypothetical protein